MEYDFRQIKKPLIAWYKKNFRDLPWRKDRIPYHIWISEIMLQQTRVEAVKDYYMRFLMECPDIQSLAQLSDERLLKLWEGLGYYNRANNLKKAANVVMDQYREEFPNEYEDVIGLPGIGEYTAGAICSICYDEATPAVDGNVLRVMTRLSDWHAVIDEQKTKKLARQMLLDLYEQGDCGLLTQSLMELGAVVCIPNGEPKCADCPLQMYCRAYALKNYMELPQRKEKKSRKIQEMTVFILRCGNEYAIRKRQAKGLLANMWEFPNINQKMETKDAMCYIAGQGYEPIELEKMIPYRHIFSHVEWHMQAYYIECKNKKKDFIWIEQTDFEKEYALPTAFKYFWEQKE